MRHLQHDRTWRFLFLYQENSSNLSMPLKLKSNFLILLIIWSNCIRNQNNNNIYLEDRKNFIIDSILELNIKKYAWYTENEFIPNFRGMNSKNCLATAKKIFLYYMNKIYPQNHFLA